MTLTYVHVVYGDTPAEAKKRMSRKKVSTTIYVTPEQSDRLKLLHERTKVPVSVYIREGIDLVLKQYAHLLPGQLSLDTSKPIPKAGDSKRGALGAQVEMNLDKSSPGSDKA